MGIFTNTRRSLASFISPDQGQNKFAGFDRIANEYTKIDPEKALKCGTVFNCLSLISSGIGEVVFTAPANTRLNSVLLNPNGWQEPGDFFQSVSWDMLLYGQAFVKIVGGAKNPIMLVPYDPEDVEVGGGTDGQPRYKNTKTNKTIRSDMILHFRDIGSHGTISVPRISSVANRINALIAADNLIADVFENGIALSFLLKSTQQVDDATMEKTLESLRASLGKGGISRGGVALLESTFDLTTMEGIKPADADLRELRVHLIREIASIFGAPPFLVGGDSDTKYSNTSARITQMYRQAFSPLLKRIAGSLDAKFATKTERDITPLLEGDFATVVDTNVKMCGGAYKTPNEVRAELNLTEVEGGDILRNVNMVDDRETEGVTPTDDGTLENIENSVVSIADGMNRLLSKARN